MIGKSKELSVAAMKLLDLSLPTPEENLALEETLLEWGEAFEVECLRFWESPGHFVVLGAGSPSRTDVNTEACVIHGVPVLRRCSGGGTVVQGPGCLNYTLVLDRQHPDRQLLESISGTNELVLHTVAKGLSACGLYGAGLQGISDLTIEGLKFSGNSQRRRKRFVLFHGTILYNMDLNLIAELLGTPEKMPDYRENRQHLGFVRNVEVDPVCARIEIARAWGATGDASKLTEAEMNWLLSRVEVLSIGRYRDAEWIWGI
jgi:lipoate-protein ligase A